MAIEQSRPKMTYAEYMALPEGFYNLIDGELIVTPAPTVHHQLLQARLLSALFVWNEQNRLGVVLGAPLDVRLREADPAIVVQPDVLFLANAHRARLGRAGIAGPPDLVVEIVSPGSERLDGVRKRRLYEQHGVPEFWLVLPDLDQVEVLTLDPSGRYRTPKLLERGDMLTSEQLPGFGLALDDLFRPERGEPVED